MRTPNCKCIICGRECYRRPFELKTVHFVCCKGCRSEAYKKNPNNTSLNNLILGREKGKNHLDGIQKSQEHKEKISITMTQWCEKNPKKVMLRGEKTRGENHYQWKGGISKLNLLIRTMGENRKWIDSVKNRCGYCFICGDTGELESHHKKEISTIIKEKGIKNRDDARNCKELWDIDNGETLCAKCHCKIHNRKYSPYGQGRRS